MLLKPPHSFNNIPDEVQAAASSILTSSVPSSAKPVNSGNTQSAKENRLERARKIFSDENLDVEDAAKTIRGLMYCDTDSVRLKAAELVLKVQGVSDEIEEKKIPEIHVNVVSLGNNNNTVVNLVTPVV